MARINLLPWREELRRERQRQFMVSALATAILGVILVFLIGVVFDQLIGNQETRNEMLRQEITRLEARITRIEQLEETRDRLISRKRIIEDLQASRSMTVELLDQLAKTIPVGVTLVTVRQQGMNLTLDGTAQSNARVSAYLQALEENDLFSGPDLRFVRASRDGGNRTEPYEFSVSVLLRSAQQRDGEEEGFSMDEEDVG